MSLDETPGHETGSEKPPVPREFQRTVSQDLRHLDDALTHAIDQLNIFNSETMSDLSLKYELIRNNEVSGTRRLPHAILRFLLTESCDWLLCPAIDTRADAR